jgi:hypothetical protein
MDPHFLLKDELEYELACRGIVLMATAPVMKKLLTELMRSEQFQGSTLELKAPQSKSVIYELEICVAKLSVLSNYISELTGKPDKNLFRRLISRLYHVQNRLALLKHDSEDESIRKEGLLQQCQVLLDRLEGQDNIVEDEDLTATDKEILQKTLGNVGLQIIEKIESQMAGSSRGADSYPAGKSLDTNQSVVNKVDRGVSIMSEHCDHRGSGRSGLVRSSTIYEDIPRRKLVPIYQWGLKFTGGNNMSVNAFLERVSELKDARNASDYDLWRYAIDFFEGEALIWYRANKEYALNWDELVILLKRAFQKPYYQEELLTEIRARTQGCDESVLIYISVMQNMFNRLPSRITESEKILIVQKNLLPYYQQSVCRDDFGSIPEMINVLRIVERTKLNCENFRQPHTSKSLLEPDLAYRTPSEITSRVEEVAEVKAVQVQGATQSQVLRRCWNCRESGHIFRDCPVPKQRLFCFRCGRFGVMSKDCECKGNAQGGSLSPAS